MALMHSTMVPLGTPAHDFSLPGTDGSTYNLARFQDKAVLVIVFMCNHCPYVKAVLDRLIALQNEMRDRGVQFVGINPNDAVRYPDDSLESMQALVREKNLPFPYLVDASQSVARQYDAVCTPDIYVYGRERTLKYRGRIDDNWKEPEKVMHRDLKEAIDNLLAERETAQRADPFHGLFHKMERVTGKT